MNYRFCFLFLFAVTFASCNEQLAEKQGNNSGQLVDKEPSTEPVTESVVREEVPEADATENEVTEEMFADFLLFRKAMLSGSCEGLANVCELPLGGDCASDLLGLSEDVPARNVTKEELLNNCSFLDETELAVLKKRTSLNANTDVNNGYCGYKDFLNVSDDGKEFSWSVGCIQLVEAEIGEYTRIFIFHKSDGHFKLYKVDCAG